MVCARVCVSLWMYGLRTRVCGWHFGVMPYSWYGDVYAYTTVIWGRGSTWGESEYMSPLTAWHKAACTSTSVWLSCRATCFAEGTNKNKQAKKHEGKAKAKANGNKIKQLQQQTTTKPQRTVCVCVCVCVASQLVSSFASTCRCWRHHSTLLLSDSVGK